jgi:hypothetical protein
MPVHAVAKDVAEGRLEAALERASREFHTAKNANRTEGCHLLREKGLFNINDLWPAERRLNCRSGFRIDLEKS